MSTAVKDKTKDLQQIDTMSDKAQVAYYVLSNQKGSGFIQEGTERLPEPIEISAPSSRSILTTSYYFKKDKDGVPRRVNIRFIHGVEEVEVQKQKAAGHEPNPLQDLIVFKNGKLTVAREGNTIGLFDFLRKTSQNKTNPDRDPSATVVFEEIVPEKEKSGLNDFEFAQADAVSKVRALIVERKGDHIKYDEDKLGVYCGLFNVTSDTLSGKLNALLGLAKTNPEMFINQVDSLENKVQLEILHAEELQMISFTSTTVQYTTKDKIIMTFTGASQSLEKRRERLVTFFQTPGGAVAYQEFLAELEAAKKSKLN